ncbi:hypothetical protein NDU88_011475 [Pleurodeles waltl]|uniref:Uncharacterized protein n=1 Tax=Pleurodeles waltl TaxID=8319 RepID=A0AAV7QXD1_PLEWA|nr:hypothetical protein NDU88_011475 [Pleurodeles waltl]
MNAVSFNDRMGAQAFTEHARAASGSKQAQPPLEKGGELAAVGGKERSLGGASKMATSSNADTWSRCTLEKRLLGATSKMAAPIHFIEEDVVIISDEQADQVEGPSGCDTSHVLGGHGERSCHRQLGRLAGEQSLPVKVRAPLEHRAEGRVKPGAVYPTSQELAGVVPLGQRNDSEDVQPSTSRGAGGGLYRVEEEFSTMMMMLTKRCCQCSGVM